MKYLLALVLALAAREAHACCFEVPVEVSFASSTDVFTGRVVRVETSSTTRSAAMRVDEVLKGTSSGEVVVRTSRTTLDAAFEVGLEYLVFANREGDALHTDSCAGTARLDFVRGELLVLQMRPRWERARP